MLWRFQSGRVCILSRCSTLSHVEQGLPAITGKFYDFCFCKVFVFCHYGFSANKVCQLAKAKHYYAKGQHFFFCLIIDSCIPDEREQLYLDDVHGFFER